MKSFLHEVKNPHIPGHARANRPQSWSLFGGNRQVSIRIAFLPFEAAVLSSNELFGVKVACVSNFIG